MTRRPGSERQHRATVASAAPRGPGRWVVRRQPQYETHTQDHWAFGHRHDFILDRSDRWVCPVLW